MSIQFVTRFNRPKGRAIRFEGPGRTKQAHKAECDINTILAKYRKTGILPGLIKANPAYGDFSAVEDYQTSIEVVRKAEEQFAALPARARERFANNPAAFLAFCADPKNGKEMIAMGLASETPSKAPKDPATTPAPRGAGPKGPKAGKSSDEPDAG